MPTDVFGVPLHPLTVHLPVVLVPLLTLLAIGYVLIPRIRQPTGWALVALSVATPVSVFVARASGQNLAQQRINEVADSPEHLAEVTASIAHHSQFGDMLATLMLGLAILALLFNVIVNGRLARFAARRSMPGLAAWAGGTATEEGALSVAPPTSRRVVVLVLGVLIVALALASVFYVVNAGHSGATMTWT